MVVGGVNGVNGYAYFQGVNPYKDKVYVDPRTGEYSTWKPGVIPPEPKKKKHTGAKIVGLALAVALALIFRGKIKEGYRLVKPHIEKVTTPVKTFLKTKTPKLFGILKNAKTFVVVNGSKLIDTIVNFATNIGKYVKGILPKVKP